MKLKWIVFVTIVTLNIGLQSYFIFSQGVSELTSLFLIFTLFLIAFAIFILTATISAFFTQLRALFKSIFLGSVVGLLCTLILTSYVNKKRRKEFVDYIHSPYNNSDSTEFRTSADSLNTIPMGLIAKDKVVSLSVAGEDLHYLPHELAKITKLDKLALNRAMNLDFQQAINVLKNTRVRDLELTDCNISYLPKEISKLKHLKRLDLSLNENLDLDSLFSLLSVLPSLEVLHIRGVKAKTLPSSISNLTNLKMLFATSTGFESLPSALTEMKQLEQVAINQNPVVDNWWKYIDSTKVKFDLYPVYVRRPY